jgi:hypothetical protein
MAVTILADHMAQRVDSINLTKGMVCPQLLHTIILPHQLRLVSGHLLYMAVTVHWEDYRIMDVLGLLSLPRHLRVWEVVERLAGLMMHLAVGHLIKVRLNSTTMPSKVLSQALAMT